LCIEGVVKLRRKFGRRKKEPQARYALGAHYSLRVAKRLGGLEWPPNLSLTYKTCNNS
jgi:hypothetical protein